MKTKHAKTLKLIYSKPISANIQWRDIEALLISLGAEASDREGSRVLIKLFDERRVFHRPHHSPNTDKGAAEAIKKWLQVNGVKANE